MIVNKNRLKIIVSWALVIAWMLIIFRLSSQVAEQSDELSTGITQAILNMIQKLVPFLEIGSGQLNHILRKGAHFTAYLILGILVVNAFSKSGISGRKSLFLGLLVCIVYAMSDELHQAFVPGRGPALTDVIIDSAGSFAGIFIYNKIKY